MNIIFYFFFILVTKFEISVPLLKSLQSSTIILDLYVFRPNSKALPLAVHAYIWFGPLAMGVAKNPEAKHGRKAVLVKALLSQLRITSEKAPALNFLHHASTPDSILAGSCNRILWTFILHLQKRRRRRRQKKDFWNVMTKM